MAIPAARHLRRQPQTLRPQVLWTLAVFTLYFWTTAAVMFFRTFHFYRIARHF